MSTSKPSTSTRKSVRVAAGQLGPIGKDESRAEVVERLIALMRSAHADGAELIVFPELALTTFFPRWFVEDLSACDHWYETEMPSAVTQPLFDTARELGIGFCLGYAERTLDEGGETAHRYNTQILVGTDGATIGHYRKVHIPGHAENEPDRPFQHAERHYFEPGPDGFGVWEGFGATVGMMICNDRRWPETYRVMGLQGAELILCGYNTPIHYVPDPTQDALAGFHNSLVAQAGAYQNGTFVVIVAKGGTEEGVESLAQSIIVAPSGEILAQNLTEGDEIVVADCDLNWCAQYKKTLFDFERYRMVEHYGLITERRGAGPALERPHDPISDTREHHG